jgi:tRNA (cytidine56-2'-O)-methyltransferase
MKVKVLRLSHRKERDKRATTHVCLAARALGAEEVVLSGEKDDAIINSVRDVVSRWGGKFKISYEPSFKRVINQAKRDGYKITHLTMYGMPIQKKIKLLQKLKKILIVVGSEKVPGEVYTLADYNIAVTNQPHSEIAALAIFMHEYSKGKELNKKFNGKIRVIPQERGKKVIKTTKSLINKR